MRISVLEPVPLHSGCNGGLIFSTIVDLLQIRGFFAGGTDSERVVHFVKARLKHVSCIIPPFQCMTGNAVKLIQRLQVLTTSFSDTRKGYFHLQK